MNAEGLSARLRSHAVCLSILLIVCPYCLGDGEIQLVLDGATEYAIMADSDAGDVERFAVQELQGYLMQMSGAFLPMADKIYPHPDKLIIVGKDAVSIAGLDVGEVYMDPEGFRIKTVGDKIVLFGGSPVGTLYSVYAFLESLGCRWFAPGVLGEVIPQRSTITIDQTDLYERPSLKYRGFTSILPVSGEHAQWIDWMAKNKMNCLMIRLSNYPDFKEILGGEVERRGMHVGVIFDGEDEKLPLGDPKTFADRLIEFVKDNPEIDIIELHAEPPKSTIKFMAEVVHLIHKVCPDKLISVQTASAQLPNGYRCHENEILSFDLSLRCYTHSLDDERCEINHENRTNLQELLKTCEKVHIYEHHMGSYEQNSLPFPILHTIVADLQIWGRLKGLDGVISQCELKNWGTYGLNYYVFSKMAWNAHYKLVDIVDDYCNKYYGVASDPMKRYFYALESAMMAKEHFQYIDPPELISELLSEDIIDQLESEIQNAKDLANDAEILDRIRKTELSLEHASLLWKMLDHYSKAHQFQGTGDRGSAREHFKRSIELGEELIAFLFQNADEGVFVITEDYIFDYLEPFISHARVQMELFPVEEKK